ncbi:MAG TPA: YqiA/YcfP family alpha/beta fold hydrolase [Casimicrobiaceae bacterium]|nr:YqiA/YcfP family alpha/beta fold hydrolase [Casimicrobiaceae bacterium]
MLHTLIYLHGFRSSPASTKARILGEAIAALPAFARPAFHVPELDHRPAVAVAAILDLASGTAPEALTFVGSSLGGYFATYAAERLGSRAVLVNPSVRPYDDLAPYRGRQVNLYTGCAFEVTDQHFGELRALKVDAISRPERYLLLVQAGDEVLDYRVAVRFYAGAWQSVQGGGDHGYAGFDGDTPTLLRFAGPFWGQRRNPASAPTGVSSLTPDWFVHRNWP